AHPKASAFRVNGFRWEEEGKALFEGVSATGSIGWGPVSRCAKPISSSSTTHEVEDEHVDHEESSSMGTMGTSNDANPVEAEFMSVEPSKKKKKQVHDIDIKFEKLIDIFMHDVENKLEAYYQKPVEEVKELVLNPQKSCWGYQTEVAKKDQKV
ncbi:hypothetical protein Taro_004497, partial [Colocasia esculenta]|nr:hypothetical protein [Colocasia esculenta]